MFLPFISVKPQFPSFGVFGLKTCQGPQTGMPPRMMNGMPQRSNSFVNRSLSNGAGGPSGMPGPGPFSGPNGTPNPGNPPHPPPPSSPLHAQRQCSSATIEWPTSPSWAGSTGARSHNRTFPESTYGSFIPRNWCTTFTTTDSVRCITTFTEYESRNDFSGCNESESSGCDPATWSTSIWDRRATSQPNGNARWRACPV